LYHLYIRWFVFGVGLLISGNRGAYRYLAESAVRFYTPEEIKEILLAAGFCQVSFHQLFLGAVGVHVAVK
ncbi:class I SAM-dependent methyltransferase, partial [Chloroflexota bacterium]